MQRQQGKRKKKVQFNEYVSPEDRIARKTMLGDTHTNYTGPRAHCTSRMALPVGIQSTIQPPPGSLESPTSQLDWVLPVETPFRMFDGDLELEEMKDYELEALGLKKYLRPVSERVNKDVEVPQKKLKTQSTHPIHFWTPYIDSYIDKFLRLEDPGSKDRNQCANKTCISLLDNGAFRCKDCWSERLLCLTCTISSHIHNPFHRIKTWTGDYFSQTNLKNLGMRIQLGHQDCQIPVNAFNNEFVVISQTGIHEVTLDYCGCPSAPSKPIQLLRACLFPSMVSDPKMAATFGVLDHFQLLSFNSKVSGYEYYQTLVRTGDNTGTKTPPDRYPVFMRIVRKWCHIWLLKCMGWGHAESGVAGTKKGECAVLCPACPHLGINLPDDWKERPASESWLYSLFIAIDANFHLKRMNVSTDE